MKLLTEIKAKKLDLAKDELYLEHCERTVKKKNEEIELLEKQLQQEKDKLVCFFWKRKKKTETRKLISFLGIAKSSKQR